MKPVILMTGHTMPELSDRRGDFDQWYANAVGWSVDRFHVVDAVGGDPLPNPHNVDALIMSGSALCVQDHAPWSVKAGHWASQVVEAGIPTLGICYGHQLLADELGGLVDKNPGGREMGVSLIDRLRDDPLFDGLPTQFPVIQTHVDAVLRAPDIAEVIAQNAISPIQAMSIGDTVRTVQWHPEFDADIIGHYISIRSEVIDSESGDGTAKKWLSELKNVDSGQIILRNFFDHFLGAL
jgi:GMP synthase (glutamine-hydrolysing)